MGPSGDNPLALGISFAVNTALPRLADIPQHSAAAAIYRYPRMGCDLDVDSGIGLLGQHFFQPLRIEADHDLLANHNGRGGVALVGSYQLTNRTGITTHVAQFKYNASLREEGLRPVAGRSTGLAIKQDSFKGHRFSLSEQMFHQSRRVRNLIVDYPLWVLDGSRP
jgi:hypothetical protein